MLVATGTVAGRADRHAHQRGAGEPRPLPGRDARGRGGAGRRARRSSPPAATVSVLDLNARTVPAACRCRASPAALAVSPDGTRVYAARKGGDRDDRRRRRSRASACASSPGTPLDLAVTATRAIVVQAGGKVAVLDLDDRPGSCGGSSSPGAAGVSIDARGRAWVSATTPRKGKRKPAARLVRIELESGGVAGSVKLGTDGGGGVGVSPDGHARDRRAGRQARAASTARPRWSTSPSGA